MDKSSFIRIYSSLPYAIRKEIIVVIEDEPYTWDYAYVEIDNGTKLGESILLKLKQMGLIDDE